MTSPASTTATTLPVVVATPTPCLVQKPLVCSGHSRGVPLLSYSSIDADGHFYLISACLDGKAMLRVGKTGDWIGTFLGHKGAVWSAALNHDSSKAITGSADYTAKIWDAVTGQELRTVQHNQIVKSVSFSPDSARICTGLQDGNLFVADTNKSDAAPTLIAHQPGNMRRALWLDANAIATCGSDGVTLWDIRTPPNKHAARALSGVEVKDMSVGVHGAKSNDTTTTSSTESFLRADMQSIVCAAADRQVAILNARDLTTLKSHKVPFDFSTVALDCAHQRIIVGGGNDFAPKVLDAVSGNLKESHKGHHGQLHCVRVAPDSATFASASEDATIRLWQSEIQNYGLWVLNNSGNNIANNAGAAAASTSSSSSSSSSSSNNNVPIVTITPVTSNPAAIMT